MKGKITLMKNIKIYIKNFFEFILIILVIFISLACSDCKTIGVEQKTQKFKNTTKLDVKDFKVNNEVIGAKTVETQLINKIKPICPVKGRVTSYFGYRFHPVTSRLDFHKAVDISAPYKSDIHPILSGKVKEIGFSKIDGNYIIISHKNNIESKYCHCETILKNKNSYVEPKNVISTVGHTGLATGDHLHLEIKINNVNIDPSLLIKIN